MWYSWWKVGGGGCPGGELEGEGVRSVGALTSFWKYIWVAFDQLYD